MDFDLSLPSGRIRARRWGDEGAPLLLCVHGLSANLTAFAELGERLGGPQRQVVAFDLRGRGRSEVTPPGTYGLDNHARDVLAVADQLGADEFDVAGWSLGALICMRLALFAPARLRSVTLIDHAGPSDRAALVPIRAGLDRLDAVVATPDAYIEAIRADGVIEPWSAFWDACYTYELEQFADGLWRPSTFRGAAEEDLYQDWPGDWSDHWRALTMPTLLIRALKPLNGALIVPDRAVAGLLSTNPAVRVVETPDSNHFTCIVDPITLSAVDELLRQDISSG
ncbi:MAG: alpha/beta hydrolase [Mycobacterium sp.]